MKRRGGCKNFVNTTKKEPTASITPIIFGTRIIHLYFHFLSVFWFSVLMVVVDGVSFASDGWNLNAQCCMLAKISDKQTKNPT